MNSDLHALSASTARTRPLTFGKRPGVNEVVSFLKNEHGGPLDMTLGFLLAQDDDFIERSPEVLQWLFPLDTASVNQPQAPVLTPGELKVLSEQAHEGNALAFSRMLRFYGLTASAHGRVHPAANWDERMVKWVPNSSQHSQNLTRVLRSLTLQGEARRANALLEFLTGLFADKLCPADRLAQRNHWVQAVRQPTADGLADCSLGC